MPVTFATGSARETHLVLRELGLFAASDEGDVACGAEHLCAAYAATDLFVVLVEGGIEIKCETYLVRASGRQSLRIRLHILVEE